MTEAETYSFGEWLKQRREYLHLTQRELAGMTFCSVPMIKKIEGDERRPSPELAELLATSLKVPESHREVFVEVARGARPVDILWQVGEEAALSSLRAHKPLLLPTPATPFVGRADELSELGTRLANPNCRLLTLVGPGGAGKTRLGIALAHSQESAFEDGAVFIPLTSITDATLIPDAIANALRLALMGSAGEQLLAYFRRRNTLLVLDNCEQMQGDLTWLSELLAHAPGVKLLATSRERLHLIEEWVYVVPGLGQSEELFVETAHRVKHDFNPATEQAAISRICQLVENLPLAVELAASWVPLISCTEIAEHIERDLAILSTDVRNVPERHRSVQAVFDHSWNLLSAAEQNALMRLSVFRGGWQVEQARSVADADLLVLRRLVDKSLVRVGENGRYDLHELVRQYASQKLHESGGEAEARQRHYDTYLMLAAQLDAQQFAPNGLEVVLRFDQEHDNIRAALDWSLENGHTEAALHLQYHLWFYWMRRGHYREGSEWAMRSIQQAAELESVHLCMVLSVASASLFIQGRYGEAEPLAQKVLPLAHRLEDPKALIIALSLFTFTSVNIEQALTSLHKGISLIQETGEMQEFLPMFYQGAATWFHSAGRVTEANDYYWKSITLFKHFGALDLVADPLERLGQLALQQGRLQEAYDLTMESIVMARASGYFGTFGAWGGSRLGLIQLYMGELDAAQQSIEEALDYFEDGRDARIKQEAFAMLSEVVLARGDVKAADEHLGTSLEICRELYRQLQSTQKLDGTPDALPIDLVPLCARASLVTAAQGRYERAVTLASIAGALCSKSGQVMLPPLQASLDKAMAAARANLSEAAFVAAWKAGQDMSLSDAFAFLLI